MTGRNAEIATVSANDLSVWEQAARDADVTLPLPGGISMYFKRIEAGEFRMGSRGYYRDEEPVHRVVITWGFYLGTFVVTQEQYRAVVRLRPGFEPDPSYFKGPRRPVENVSWQDANLFCEILMKWLEETKRKNLPLDARFACLPTEAEWEYACRGGDERNYSKDDSKRVLAQRAKWTEYYNGDGEAALAAVGWYDENSGRTTHDVDEVVCGMQEWHRYGLYGMHGNVFEWCHDECDEAARRLRVDGVKDPGWCEREDDWMRGLGRTTDVDRIRVLRGGSWCNPAWYCRSACRGRFMPVDRNWDGGFRVCLVRGPAGGRGARQGRGAPPAPGGGARGTRPEADGGSKAPATEPDLARAKFPGHPKRE